jgi:hypothetical protein
VIHLQSDQTQTPDFSADLIAICPRRDQKLSSAAGILAHLRRDKLIALAMEIRKPDAKEEALDSPARHDPVNLLPEYRQADLRWTVCQTSPEVVDLVKMGMRVEDFPRDETIELPAKEFLVVIAQFPGQGHQISCLVIDWQR